MKHQSNIQKVSCIHEKKLLLFCILCEGGEPAERRERDSKGNRYSIDIQ